MRGNPSADNELAVGFPRPFPWTANCSCENCLNFLLASSLNTDYGGGK